MQNYNFFIYGSKLFSYVNNFLKLGLSEFNLIGNQYQVAFRWWLRINGCG